MPHNELESAPLCPVCHVAPVQWRYWAAKKDQGWCQYCSRSCCGKANAGSGHLMRLNSQRSVSRYVATIKHVLGEAYKDGDAVALKQIVQIARSSYERGAQADYQRRYRRTLADRRAA